MADLDGDAVLDEYVARRPAARAALVGDPLFAAHLEWMRRSFALLEPALYREGLDRVAIRRVVTTLVYGVSDPDEAIGRMADREEQITKAQWEKVSLVVDAEMAASLAELLAEKERP